LASRTKPNRSIATAGITCPTGHPNCSAVSFPILYNDIFWQNRAFHIDVKAPGATGTTAGIAQALVTLVPALQQTATGACPADDGAATPTPVSYWDLGFRGDTGPTDHSSTFTLNPQASVLTDITSYPGGGQGFRVNTNSNPSVIRQYCNGSKRPPEAICHDNNTGLAIPCGYNVPPGTNETNVPNPVFNLTANATVDEGNNWVSISWGPLALSVPWAAGGAPLADYSLANNSPAINYILPGGQNGSPVTYAAAPFDDFFGNLRKTNNAVDAGAIEFLGSAVPVVAVTPTTLTFSTVAGTTSAAQILTVSNTGGAAFSGVNIAVSASYARPNGNAGGTCGATLAAASSCTINVVFSPATTASGTVNGTVAITGNNATVTGSPVTLNGTVIPRTFTATVTPTSLAFGTQAAGTTSAALTLTVTNTGNSALTGASFTFGGGTPQPFAHPGTGNGPNGCGGTLAVGASCTYRVTFSPATAATFSRTLTVAYTGATVTGSPVTLTGTGTGLAVVAFTGPANTPLTTGSPNRAVKNGTITVRNTGNANLVLTTAPTITQGSQGVFAITGGTCGINSTLTPAPPNAGSTCTITVRYTPPVAPTVLATSTATITLSDTGAAATTQTYSFNGN